MGRTLPLVSMARIGISLFVGHHDNLGSLLKCADLSMCLVFEEAGGDSIRFHDSNPPMNSPPTRRIATQTSQC